MGAVPAITEARADKVAAALAALRTLGVQTSGRGAADGLDDVQRGIL
jgi:hypothetical protein